MKYEYYIVSIMLYYDGIKNLKIFFKKGLLFISFWTLNFHWFIAVLVFFIFVIWLMNINVGNFLGETLYKINVQTEIHKG